MRDRDATRIAWRRVIVAIRSSMRGAVTRHASPHGGAGGPSAIRDRDATRIAWRRVIVAIWSSMRGASRGTRRLMAERGGPSAIRTRVCASAGHEDIQATPRDRARPATRLPSLTATMPSLTGVCGAERLRRVSFTATMRTQGTAGRCGRLDRLLGGSVPSVILAAWSVRLIAMAADGMHPLAEVLTLNNHHMMARIETLTANLQTLPAIIHELQQLRMAIDRVAGAWRAMCRSSCPQAGGEHSSRPVRPRDPGAVARGR